MELCLSLLGTGLERQILLSSSPEPLHQPGKSLKPTFTQMVRLNIAYFQLAKLETLGSNFQKYSALTCNTNQRDMCFEHTSCHIMLSTLQNETLSALGNGHPTLEEYLDPNLTVLQLST